MELTRFAGRIQSPVGPGDAKVLFGEVIRSNASMGRAHLYNVLTVVRLGKVEASKKRIQGKALSKSGKTAEGHAEVRAALAISRTFPRCRGGEEGTGGDEADQVRHDADIARMN